MSHVTYNTTFRKCVHVFPKKYECVHTCVIIIYSYYRESDLRFLVFTSIVTDLFSYYDNSISIVSMYIHVRTIMCTQASRTTF